MKKFLLIVFVFNLSYALAQNPWTSLTSFPPEIRAMALSFEINGKIYVCGGAGPGSSPGSYRNDLWQFDPATNSWTSKANFPGPKRWYAVAFSLNGYGYVGLGAGNFTDSYKDFYKYDPTNDSWSRIHDYPTQTQSAISFSLNGLAYVGGGWSYISNNVYKNTFFYSYNPSTDTWAPNANLPGYVSDGVAFGLNGKGYAGLGTDQAGQLTSAFYQYDPSSNTWSTLQNFPGASRIDAISISTSRYGYIFFGSGLHVQYADVWRFDSNNLSWAKLNDFPSGNRTEACGAYYNNNIYLGIGEHGSVFQNDWWQYKPDCDVSLSISGPSLICSSGNFSVNNPPTTSVTWSSSNSSVLNFPNPTTSGTANRMNNSNGNVSVSASINSGCGAASLPSVNVWVGSPGTPGPLSASLANMCINSQVAETISAVPGASSYSWVSNNPTGLGVDGQGTGAMITGLASSPSGSYWTFTITAYNQCNVSGTSAIWGVVIGHCNAGGGHQNAIIAFPNPVSNQLTVAIAKSTESTSEGIITNSVSSSSLQSVKIEDQFIDTNVEFNAKLYDKNSVLVKSGPSKNGVITFDLIEVQNGLYYLTLERGSELLRQHIMVSK